MLRTISIILFLILFFLVGIPLWGIGWIIERFDRNRADLFYLRLGQWSMKVMLALAGVHVDVYGEENVPKDQAVLYVGNHRSYFDILITYSRCPRLTGYVSKDSLLKVPFLRGWMKRMHCLFLDRTDIKQGLKMILTGVDQMKNGISMCIFPEGTRGKAQLETDMNPFKEGSFKMAEKSGCPIVPMALVGTADILEKHFPAIRSAHAKLMYGKPIYIQDLDKEQKKHLGTYTQEIIRQMLEEELQMQ